jgi:protein Mpv17
MPCQVSVWPLVQSVNFSVVPVRHQLLVINMFTIVDAAFMSWARGQVRVTPGGGWPAA